MVPLFRGHVLNYTGDELIAYFAEPSFNSMNALAIDCALTMRRLMPDGLNRAFSAQGLRSLTVRIGLEAGDAFVATIGRAGTKRQSDIVGEVVNIAAKIQAVSPANGICLGEAAVSALHVSWRQVRKRDGSIYVVHELVSEGNSLDAVDTASSPGVAGGSPTNDDPESDG